MTVSGDDQISPSLYGALQDAVVWGVVFDDIESECGGDDFGYSRDEFDPIGDYGPPPRKPFSEHRCYLSYKGRSDKELITSITRSLPDQSGLTARVGKRRDIHIGVEDGSKPSAARGAHG